MERFLFMMSRCIILLLNIGFGRYLWVRWWAIVAAGAAMWLVASGVVGRAAVVGWSLVIILFVLIRML